jgi:chromosome partitioning protein
LIYSIANQKGGVGKTTTAVNLGAGFAQLGKKVLVVDLDQQANATVAFGLDKSDLPTSYEVLSGEVTLSEAALPAGPENVWLVPASRDLAGAVVELPTLENPNSRLSEQIGSVDEDYDMVLIDCPPALGPITVNALVASDRVIIPVQAEYLALEGLVEFLDTISMVRQQLNPGLALGGILVTMHDERTRLAQQVEADLRDHFSETVFRTVIPRTVRVAEAPSYGIPVTDYAPSSRGSEAYLALAEEVLSRG